MDFAPLPGSRPGVSTRWFRDVLCIVGIAGLGVGLRLRYFSGLGLGDDVLLRNDIASIVTYDHVLASVNAYRFTWWIPTALTSRWFGLGDAGLITPIVVFDAIGMVIVYLFAKVLWGRGPAIIAGLLLVALPLDFAWSTMLAMDVILSFFCALTMLFVWRALEQDDPHRRRRDAALAALFLLLAYHSKLSAALLVPAIAATAWSYRHRLDASVVLTFVGTAAFLFVASLLVTYVITGDALAAYHMELVAQGLTPADGKTHQLMPGFLQLFANWLFWPIFESWTGGLLFSVYPHLLVVLALAGLVVGVRAPAVLVWWFAFVFLGMTFNVQRVNGMWVAGFRNFRHSHVFVYPLVLLLTAYLAAWWARFPRSAAAFIALLFGVSLWESTAIANVSHVSFGDMRRACAYLATLQPQPVYSDFQLGSWMGFAGLPERGWVWHDVPALPRPQKQQMLAAVTAGYLVTGGGREPYYGCTFCIPSADDVPPEGWTLLREFPSPIPPTPWRPEPLRIWQRAPHPT